VDLAVRVVKSFYSQNFNTYYITAVTESNGAVMFTYRERFDFNTELKIRGNVREHGAEMTRLNRVKVL
jgi:predicted amidohydrolase